MFPENYNNASPEDTLINESGQEVNARDYWHGKALSLRMNYIEKEYLNYAIKDFETYGITEDNYLDVIWTLDENTTYTQAVYSYAMELKHSESTKYMVRDSDGSLDHKWVRSVQIIGKSQGTPRNNRAQNEQTKSAAQKYNLSKEGQRLLHDNECN